MVAPAAAQQVDPAAVAGCYDVHLSAWEDLARLSADSVYYRPPPRIRLSTQRAGRGPGQFRIAVPDGSLPSPHAHAFWSVEADGIRLVWSTGFMGVGARVQPTERGLEGVAWRFTDEIGPGREPLRATLVATRVACSSPTPFPVADADTLIRRVRLRAGPELVLGERLPAVDVTAPAAVAGSPVRIDGAAVGALAGNDGVAVRYTENGILYWIRLGYPPGTDGEDLLDRLRGEIGPWHGEERSGARRTFYWQTRVTTGTFTRTPDGRFYVSFSDPRVW